MIKEIKYFIYIFTIILFFFLTIKFYLSETNIKNTHRSINYKDENININDLDLKVLKNNTVDIIEYVDNQLDDEEEYKFWELLQIN
tara:strand:+ start:1566 stop:1823 length:258 start_codon:yes stop_codon:yes gene_type:complete